MYSVYWIHYEYEKDINTQGYVGCTKDLESRTQEHVSDYKQNRKGRPVAVMIRANGAEGVEITEVLTGSKKECYAEELRLRPKPDVGWNIRAGGSRTVHSAESKAKISKAKKGKVNHRKGLSNTKEHTAKMVATRKARGNYNHSEETKANFKLNAKCMGDSPRAVSVRVELACGTVTVFTSIKEASVVANIGYSSLRSRLRNSRTKMLNGYAVSYV